jgi:hypothetical protein
VDLSVVVVVVVVVVVAAVVVVVIMVIMVAISMSNVACIPSDVGYITYRYIEIKWKTTYMNNVHGMLEFRKDSQ